MNRTNSRDGTQIAYDSVGEGPPLILVVGAFCDRFTTTSLVTLLQRFFTVYAYDRRGRGDSTNTRPYAIEREIEDLSALIGDVGTPTFVFGHSSGAALALEAAAAGLPIRSLVVYEPPYTEGPNDAFADRLESLVAEGRLSDAAATFLELIGTPAPVIKQMQGGPYWPRMEAFAPTLAHEVRLCNGGQVPTDRLTAIACPTLVVTGSESPPWSSEVARNVANAIPNSRSEVLLGQGHEVADDPLAELLSDFFASGELRSS